MTTILAIPDTTPVAPPGVHAIATVAGWIAWAIGLMVAILLVVWAMKKMMDHRQGYGFSDAPSIGERIAELLHAIAYWRAHRHHQRNLERVQAERETVARQLAEQRAREEAELLAGLVTWQQAADLLRISHPDLMRELDAGGRPVDGSTPNL